MFDQDGRRHRAPVQDVERDGNNSVTVLLREIRSRADETRSRLAQLGPSVRRGVLVRDRAAPLRLTADKEQCCLYRCIVETYIDVR